MKLFHFHILLIRSFVLYVLTCLLISQSALLGCPGCGSTGDTLPDSPLCPSCISLASEFGAGAEAEAKIEFFPEDIRTVFRRAIDNLPPDHALFRDGRYESIIDALREPANIAPPTDVSHFLDEMERQVETLNNQVTVNDSNRFQLVQPRNAFTFPLTVMHALSNGVLDRENIYRVAFRTFVILQILFSERATTEQQQSARQPLISSLYEALLIYLLLKSSNTLKTFFLVDTLREYINSYRSQFSRIPPGYSVLWAVTHAHVGVHSPVFNHSYTLTGSMQLRNIASPRPAALLEYTFNNVSYMALHSRSLPPATVTISSDQSDTFLQNVRDVLSSSPEINQPRFEQNEQNDHNFLESINRLFFSQPFARVIVALGLLFSLNSNTGK